LSGQREQHHKQRRVGQLEGVKTVYAKKTLGQLGRQRLSGGPQKTEIGVCGNQSGIGIRREWAHEAECSKSESRKVGGGPVNGDKTVRMDGA